MGRLKSKAAVPAIMSVRGVKGSGVTRVVDEGGLWWGDESLRLKLGWC